MLNKRTRPPITQIDKTFEFAGQNHQNVSALFFGTKENRENRLVAQKCVL